MTASYPARELTANLGVESRRLDDLFRCYCGARVVLCHTQQSDLYWAHSQWSGDPDHEIGLTASTVRYNRPHQQAERPTDFDIVLYINDLELTLADAEVTVMTNRDRLDRVHGWAAHYGARAEVLRPTTTKETE